MIEHGPDIKSQIENGLAKPDLSTLTVTEKGPKYVNIRDI